MGKLEFKLDLKTKGIENARRAVLDLNNALTKLEMSIVDITIETEENSYETEYEKEVLSRLLSIPKRVVGSPTVNHTTDSVQKKIDELQIRLEVMQKRYSSLGQMDMLSGEGNSLRRKINKREGAIEALKWIIDPSVEYEL